jgi:hypothetical protein
MRSGLRSNLGHIELEGVKVRKICGRGGSIEKEKVLKRRACPDGFKLTGGNIRADVVREWFVQETCAQRAEKRGTRRC